MRFKNRIQIFTEDINRKKTLGFIAQLVEGFNYQTFKGVYKGKEEDSIRFDFWCNDKEAIWIQIYLIPYLLISNNQDCIGLIVDNDKPYFIFDSGSMKKTYEEMIKEKQIFDRKNKTYKHIAI